MKTTASTLIFLLLTGMAMGQNVGIGTTTPGTTLEINGGLTVTPKLVTVLNSPFQVPSNASIIFISSSTLQNLTLIPPVNQIYGQKLLIRDVGTNPSTEFDFDGIKFRNQMEFVYTSSGTTSKWEPLNYINGGIIPKVKLAMVFSTPFAVEDNIGQLYLSASLIPFLTITPPPNPIYGQKLLIRDVGTNPSTEFDFNGIKFKNQMEFVYTSSGATSKWEPVTNFDSESFREFGQPGQPILESGWSNYLNGYSKSAFYKDKENRVHLRGTLITGLTGSTILTLPVGYRPSTSGTLMFNVNNGNSLGRIDIQSNGNVNFVFGPSLGTWVSLDGISFRAD